MNRWSRENIMPAVSCGAGHDFVTSTRSHRHAACSVINAHAHGQELIEIQASPCMEREREMVRER
jgi:hypothetical protein